MQKRNSIAILLMSGVMFGCSQGSSNSSNNGNNVNPQPAPDVLAQQVTIDPMTTIPSLNGTSTKGVLYIHNYGTSTINGISFNVKNSTTVNKSKNRQASQLVKKTLAANDVHAGLSLTDTSKCTSIPAGGYCAVGIATPVLGFADSGSDIVEMNFTQNGKSKKTYQVVPYAYVDSNSSNSINFLGGISVAMPQTKIRHAVAYLYASGKSNAVFNKVEIAKSINYAGFKVVRGFVNKQQVTAGQVIPVEIEIERQSNKPLSFQTYAKWGSAATTKSVLKADAVSTGNPASVSVDPLGNQVSFIVGQAAIMQAPSTQDNSVKIINNGSADADSGIEVVAVSGDGYQNLIINNGCLNSHLIGNGSDFCSVGFSVTDYSSGNALVEYRYKGEKIASQMLYWVNKKAVPSIKATPSISTVSYQAASTPDEIVTYTLQNIGKAPLKSATYLSKLTNQAVTEWEEVANNCTDTINPGTGCSIGGKFKPKSEHGNGYHSYYIKGTNNGKEAVAYPSVPIKYTISGEPVLSINASNNAMILVADGVSTVSKTFTVRNDGNVKATNLEASIIDASANDPKPVIDSNGCANELAKDASCEVTVKYGPAPLDYNVAQNGTVTLQVDYRGGTTNASRNVQKATDYQLMPYNSNVVVDDPSAENINGSGTENDPFTTNSTVDGSKIIIEYRNDTAVDMNNFNVNTNTIPPGYIISPETTCPIGIDVGTLPANSSCKLVLIPDPATLADLPGATSNTDISFDVPTASWKVDDKSFTQPGNKTIYVYYTQPQVSFAYIQNGTNVNLSLTVANGELLPALASPDFVFDQFSYGPLTVSGGCSSTLLEDFGDGMGYYSVSCDLHQGNAQITVPMPDYLCDETFDYNLSIENPPVNTVIPAYFGFQYVAPVCGN